MMVVHMFLRCPDVKASDELTEHVHNHDDVDCDWCLGNADPDRYGVGDPDPTTGAPYPQCNANGPRTDWICTRESGHPGKHVAGDGDTVLLVWREQ